MAINSRFYRDVSKIERSFRGITLRHVKGYALITLTGLVTAAELFFLPFIIAMIVIFPTAILMGAYPALLIANKWRYYKRKFELYFMYEDSIYQSNQIRRYDKREFITDKNSKETDHI